MSDYGQGLTAAHRPHEAPHDPPGLAARIRRTLARRRRVITGAMSAAVHAALIVLLFQAQASPPRVMEPEPIIPVQLVQAVRPVELPAPHEEPVKVPAKTPEPVKTPPPPRNLARRTPVPPDIEPLAAGEGPTEETVADLSEAQLAGATTAGSGQPGGACNMAKFLQNALRKDRMVQAAMAEAHRGKAIVVWNGDWIRRPDQEGAGLAAVREAIMWEVAFAPAACRAEPVRGLVLISLNDAPGSARLVVGSERWRWSDLLFARPASVSRE